MRRSLTCLVMLALLLASLAPVPSTRDGQWRSGWRRNPAPIWPPLTPSPRPSAFARQPGPCGAPGATEVAAPGVSRVWGRAAFPTVLARGLRERGVTPLIYWQPTNPANPTGGLVRALPKHHRGQARRLHPSLGQGCQVVRPAGHRAARSRDEWHLVPVGTDQLRQQPQPLREGLASRRQDLPQQRRQERQVPVEPFPTLWNLQQLRVRDLLSRKPVRRLRRGFGSQLGGRRVDVARRPRRRVPG